MHTYAHSAAHICTVHRLWLQARNPEPNNDINDTSTTHQRDQRLSGDANCGAWSHVSSCFNAKWWKCQKCVGNVCLPTSNEKSIEISLLYVAFNMFIADHCSGCSACQGRWRHLVQGTLRPLSLQSHPSPRTETWLEKQGRTKHNQTESGPKPHETIGCRNLRLFECFAWNHCWNYCCDSCGSLALLRSPKRKHRTPKLW